MAGQATEAPAQRQDLRQAKALVSSGFRILDEGGREAMLGWAAVMIRRQLRPEEEEGDDERR
jgi:hypothetical protein